MAGPCCSLGMDHAVGYCLVHLAEEEGMIVRHTVQHWELALFQVVDIAEGGMQDDIALPTVIGICQLSLVVGHVSEEIGPDTGVFAEVSVRA